MGDPAALVRQTMAGKYLIAIAADLHVGSYSGLCRPMVTLDQGGQYQASDFQKALYQAWARFWQEAKEQRRGRKLIVLLLGDLMELPGRAGVWATSLDEALRECQSLLEEVRSWVRWDELYVLRGTPFHVGEGGGPEETLARALGAVPEGDLHARYRLQLEVEGYLIDAAHHAWGATRQWTISAAPGRLAAEILASCAELGLPVPNLVLRAHNHRVADTGDTFANIRVIYCPAWQGVTAHAMKRGLVRPADIGGVVIKLPERHIEIKRMLTIR